MKKLLTLFTLTLISFTTKAQSYIIGDVNGDKQINVTDVTMLVAHILGQQNSDFIAINADVNRDGSITVTDVTKLVDHILSGSGGNGGTIGITSSYLRPFQCAP